MSEHQRHEHHGSHLPHGCEQKQLGSHSHRYARKDDRFWQESRKHPGTWRELDRFGSGGSDKDYFLCMSLEEEWDGESVSSKKARRRKGSRSDDLKETGKDSHGRNWYYDDASKGGQRYYFILGMFRKAKKPRCAEVEIITSKGKATHLLGEREMTMLLKQVNKVFGRLYGKTRLLKVVLPDSRVIQ